MTRDQRIQKIRSKIREARRLKEDDIETTTNQQVQPVAQPGVAYPPEVQTTGNPNASTQGVGVVQPPLTAEEQKVVEAFRNFKAKKIAEKKAKAKRVREEEIDKEEGEEIVDDLADHEEADEELEADMIEDEAEEKEILDDIKTTLDNIAQALGVDTFEDIDEDLVDDGTMAEEDYEMVESIRAKYRKLKMKERTKAKRVREGEFETPDSNEDGTTKLGKITGEKNQQTGDLIENDNLDLEDAGMDKKLEALKKQTRVRREKLAALRKKAMSEAELEQGEDWPTSTASENVAFSAEGEYSQEKAALPDNGYPREQSAEDAEGEYSQEKDQYPTGDSSLNEERADIRTAKKFLEKKKLNFASLMKKGFFG